VRDDHGSDYQVVHGGAVVGVAAVAAVASYEHAYALVRAHGETGWLGRLVPLTVDGLIYASSMVLQGEHLPARSCAYEYRPGRWAHELVVGRATIGAGQRLNTRTDYVHPLG
jgi:hypothetical protein